MPSLDNFLELGSRLPYGGLLPGLKFIAWLTVVGLVVRIVDHWLDRMFRRSARLVRRKADERLIRGIHGPLVVGLLAFGIIQGLPLLDLEPGAARTIRRVVISTYTLVVALGSLRLLIPVLEPAFNRTEAKSSLDVKMKPLVLNLAKLTVIAVTIGAILAQWDVDITPILASAGIAGIALALAAQETLANFLGGVSIFVDATYRLGDYIVLDSGERGEVVDIGIRSTNVKTRDDVVVTVPNSIMANSKIINESRPTRPTRVRLPVGVAYDSDMAAVEAALLEVARSSPLVLPSPAPIFRVRAFGESSVDTELLAWIMEPALRGRALHELHLGVLATFGARGITIPFPRRDVKQIDTADSRST